MLSDLFPGDTAKPYEKKEESAPRGSGARLTADEARRLARAARGLPSNDELIDLILKHASGAATNGQIYAQISTPDLDEAVRLGNVWVEIKAEIERLGFSIDWEVVPKNANFEGDFLVTISWDYAL